MGAPPRVLCPCGVCYGKAVESVSRPTGRAIGRYVLYSEVAAGGMAAVHLGQLRGPAGFSRTVAIKRLHSHFAKDPEFVAMFLDEARLAARIRHPNVASVLDVVTLGPEVFLVMEYIHGESLYRLLRAASGERQYVPIPVAVGIVCGALRGLHAAHEATGERGEPLSIVHRDVSPQNILVGEDGVPSVVDFGVAKAATRAQVTREGQLKGKLAYMSPEQLHERAIDRRADVYAAAVVLWETLTNRRLFAGDNPGRILVKITEGDTELPSRYRPDVPPRLERIVMKALALRRGQRYATASEMAMALEDAVGAASPGVIGNWVKETAKETLAQRARALAAIETPAEHRGEKEPLSLRALRLAKAAVRPSRFSSADLGTAAPDVAAAVPGSPSVAGETTPEGPGGSPQPGEPVAGSALALEQPVLPFDTLDSSQPSGAESGLEPRNLQDQLGTLADDGFSLASLRLGPIAHDSLWDSNPPFSTHLGAQPRSRRKSGITLIIGLCVAGTLPTAGLFVWGRAGGSPTAVQVAGAQPHREGAEPAPAVSTRNSIVSRELGNADSGETKVTPSMVGSSPPVLSSSRTVSRSGRARRVIVLKETPAKAGRVDFDDLTRK